MKKIICLLLLSFWVIFAKELTDGHIKDAILTFKKEGESLYIQNINSIFFKNKKVKIQECVAIKEVNKLQITCLSDSGQTIFFILKDVLLQKNGDALITSPFFKATIIDSSEILKLDQTGFKEK